MKLINLDFNIVNSMGEPTDSKASIIFAEEQSKVIVKFRNLEMETEATAMEDTKIQFQSINQANMTNEQYDIVNGWLNNNYAQVVCPFYGESLKQLKEAFNV